MFGKRKILVVDNDLASSDMLKVVLEQAGYQVIEGYDGPSAIKKANDLKPDLIILDINMPDMDGFEVLETLKLNKKTSKIPVIMCTARTDFDSTEKTVETGAQGYIFKPYIPKNVLEKIKTILP